MKQTRQPCLQAKLFGRFEFRAGEKVLNDDNIRSEMLTKLFSYCLCHRQRPIGAQEFVDILWEEDESDNPLGALKNLMYRLRALMKKVLGEGDFILTSRGAYMWNPDLTVKLDIEEFAGLCKKADEPSLAKEEKQRILLEACKLYAGPFLPKLSTEQWVVPLVTYYHSMYLTCVKELTILLDEAKEYDIMAEVCSAAIDMDPLDEKLHYFLIKALIGQGKQGLALEHYTAATAMLYENLGVSPSDELRALYRDIVKLKHVQEMDISVIQEDLAEAIQPKGAFFCDYGIFREVYRLEYRRMERMGMSVYVSLITLTLPSSMENDRDKSVRLISSAMRQMRLALADTLRVGDVVSQYSASQYIALLPTCTYENANAVMQRVVSRYYKINKKQIAAAQISYAQFSEGQ